MCCPTDSPRKRKTKERSGMNIGTRSVLFGTHQCLWHPFTVWLAFRRVHKRWPTWWENIGILCHDTFGYWGKPNIDGPEGVQHPYLGAEIAGKIVDLFSKQKGWQVREFCLFHSSTLARTCKVKTSNLYLPDKCALLFDPKWFYLFRARLSGELTEFMAHNPKGGESEWFDWYKKSVERKLKLHDNAPKT